MNCYPANEQGISDIERGRCCRLTVPVAADNRPMPGEVVLFALAFHRPGELPEFVKGGDCVQVSLTSVLDLGTLDSLTGDPLLQFSWSPLGQAQPTGPAPKSSRRR